MKVNKDGRECASWCDRDHQGENSGPWCRSGMIGGSPGYAELEQEDYEDSPNLDAWAIGRTPEGNPDSHFLTAESVSEAQRLADFIRAVAQMRKPEIRALAANVEKAAAEAWPEKEAEAS